MAATAIAADARKSIRMGRLHVRSRDDSKKQEEIMQRIPGGGAKVEDES
jgi:hypothetical protein